MKPLGGVIHVKVSKHERISLGIKVPSTIAVFQPEPLNVG